MFENFSENGLKGDLSNATTFNPCLFSLVNTFNLANEYVKIEKKKLTLFIHIKTNEFLMNQVVLLDYKSDKVLALSIHPKKLLHEFQLY